MKARTGETDLFRQEATLNASPPPLLYLLSKETTSQKVDAGIGIISGWSIVFGLLLIFAL